jgi:hypothetical protein
MMIAEGCPESAIEAVVAGLSIPAGPTLNTLRLDPPLLVTYAQILLDVIPPASGFDPAEAAAGDNAVNAPVAGL